ncbi:MAG: hypothetical protein IT454_21685 [Planctomycetes bacterium]|nr:hypothetical protein [Planctomycetota bacterium]
MKSIHLPWRVLIGAAVLLASAGVPAWADRVITHDNRVLTCKKVREKDGGYLVEFEHGTVVLKDKALVKAVEIEGDASEYIPQNDDERKKLADGYVKYRGKWFSKNAYADELRREAEASKKRADEIAAHTDWNNPWTKETKHFLLYSNTSPELIEYYAELFEAYYDLMDNRFGIKPSPVLGRTKMSVKIFKSRKEFLKLSGADSPSVLGFFNRATQELCLFHNYQEPSQTEWVGLHECTHLLTYLIDPQYFPQIWLNEAVADYFGSAEISRDKKGKLVIKPGTLQNDRVLTVQNAIRDGNDTKLDKLFDIARDDFDGFQYAHAWSFIYFLNEAGPKTKKAFDKFFKDLYTQAKGIEYESIAVPAQFDKSGTAKQASAQEIRRVVLQTLGVKDLATLEKDWKDFVAAVKMDTPDQRFKRAYFQVALGRILEVRGGRVDGAATRKNAEQALADIDFALQNGIATARAYGTRAQIYDFLDRDEDAKADLQKAIEIEPLAARYRWELGRKLYPGFAGLADEDGGTLSVEQNNAPKLAPDAKEQLGLAAELDPDTYRDLFRKLPQ